MPQPTNNVCVKLLAMFEKIEGTLVALGLAGETQYCDGLGVVPPAMGSE